MHLLCSMAASIDIVIPSFRLDGQYLLPLLQLKPPDGFSINYYLVADNPVLAIPASIQQLIQQGHIHLLVNPLNLGFSPTRNRGIDAGHGDWILLLDDDVRPEPNLLQAYAHYIRQQPDAIGFAGVTCFPAPINADTQALRILGISTHFERAKHEPKLYWSATANMLLNRAKLANRRFSPDLKKSTEDMELLFRNAHANGLQAYQAAPDAIVHHPWWNNGSAQTRRVFQYGEGAAEAARMHPVNQYNYYDFPNTLETLLLLVAVAIPIVVLKSPLKWLFYVALAQLSAEILTNYYRTLKTGHTFNPLVLWQVTWHKNAIEAGCIWGWLRIGRVQEFSRRTDGSFRKPHPQYFRLNQFKIVKIILFILLLALLFLQQNHEI